MPNLVVARDPAHASGRLRKAAEHYVRNGCKVLYASLIFAGYTHQTARDPAKNGLGHDRLVRVASYHNRGAQQTARSLLSRAIKHLGDTVDNQAAAPAIRGYAAKVIIDTAGREAEKDDTSKISEEEQGKWMALIKHQKRTLLRRGLYIGFEAMTEAAAGERGFWTERAERLYQELDWALGKGPRPEWMEGEDEELQRPEGDPQPGSYVEAEVLQITDGVDPAGADGPEPEGRDSDASPEAGAGPGAADPE